MNKFVKYFLTYRWFETKLPFVISLTSENCQKRKYPHSYAPPYSMVRPPSQSRQTNPHKQAVYCLKSSTRHTWSWRRWYLSVLGISCTRCLLLEYTLENTETPREQPTLIPTKNIFSPDQLFTKLQRKSPPATCLSSRVNVLTKQPSTTSPSPFTGTTYTGNTTLFHPPEKPSAFSPPRNEELWRKWNWAYGLEVGATVREVKIRYRTLARRLHPDKNDPSVTGLTSEEAVELFKIVNNAQQFLCTILRN